MPIIISRWLLKLDITKCLLNGSHIGLRGTKLVCVVRGSKAHLSSLAYRAIL